MPHDDVGATTSGMLVEGEVALESVVWLTGSDDGEIARALARALPTADWQITVVDRAQFRLRGGLADIEPRIGNRWAGLVMGRIATDVAAPTAFAPYASDIPPAPLHLESCWFAVDSDGSVACFDRDQLGAAPIKRCRGPHPAPAHAPPEASALVHELPGEHARGTHVAHAFSFAADGLALAAELARAAPQCATRRWLLRVSHGRVVVSGGIGAVGTPVDPSLIDWIHARGICLGCTRVSVLDPRLRGVFVYQHQGLARAAPYDRTADPNIPWSIEHAASALGLSPAVLARSRLPVRFASKDRLQPIEYAQCTWSETVPWESEAGVRIGASMTAR